MLSHAEEGLCVSAIPGSEVSFRGKTHPGARNLRRTSSCHLHLALHSAFTCLPDVGVSQNEEW